MKEVGGGRCSSLLLKFFINSAKQLKPQGLSSDSQPPQATNEEVRAQKGEGLLQPLWPQGCM